MVFHRDDLCYSNDMDVTEETKDDCTANEALREPISVETAQIGQ